MLAQIKSAADAAPTAAAQWLTGNWDLPLWERGLHARISTKSPAITLPFSIASTAISIANTAALTAAGITGKTQPRKAGAH